MSPQKNSTVVPLKPGRYPNRSPRLLHGDAREVSKFLTGPIDLTISSPPYYGLKDYKVANQIGHEESYDDYLTTLVNVFKQVADSTKKEGSLWLILDLFKERGRLRPLPFDLADRLGSETDWKLQDVIIWNKKKTLPWSHRGNLRHLHEYILFFTKSHDYRFYLDRIREPFGMKGWWHAFPERYSPKGKAPSDIWDIIIPTQGTWGRTFIEHFCPFPPDLVERIVLLTTNRGNVVFDPFSGSGMVLAISAVMGRRALGVEINKEYIDRFEKQTFPEIKRLWEERSGYRLRLQKLQDQFRRDITVLRQIKYAKLIRKEIISTQPASIPTLVISRSNNKSRRVDHGNRQSNEITLGFSKIGSPEELLVTLEDLSGKKPLNGFGISPQFQIASLSELNGTTGKYWVYGNGSIARPTGFVDFSRGGLKRLQTTYSETIFPLILADRKADIGILNKHIDELEKMKASWNATYSKFSNEEI